MDRLIRQITNQLVSQLPENENFYQIQNLDEYGFPPFLIRRIHIELQWNLDESMVLPKTDWANTQSDAVQQSWQRFLNAIHAEVQLPASYARAVIETAVADVVEILIQPRKSIPEILFGGEEVLTAEQLNERAELLVVYPHFTRVLTTFMERKNKEKLDREHCKRIVIQVDEKITYQYTPLQWAQMLDPLFSLAGNSIDTNIFRLFFEDKKRPRIARKFDLMNEDISRATFIEVLSSPEMLNYEGYEPDQSELFSGERTAEPEKEIQQEQDFNVETTSENGNDIEETDKQPEEDQHVEEQSVGNVFSDFSDEEGQVDEEEDSEEDEVHVEEEPVKKKAVNGDIPESTQQAEQALQDEKQEEPEEEEAPLNQMFVDSDEEQETDLDNDQPEIDTPNEASETAEEENEDSVIWQNFLDADTEENDQKEDLADEPLYDDEYLDEPVIDLTENDHVAEEEQNLEKLLESERSYYVQELFGGSEQAYEESLREIARQNDWKSASKQIEKNIFRRNMIDIYSEPAVDFTDRLQTYFLDKKTSNK